jgi:hypothetical protein
MDFILASTVGPGRHAPKEDREHKMNGVAQAAAAYWRLINQTYGSISGSLFSALMGTSNDRGFDKIVDMQWAPFWITSITKETPDFTE